MTQEELDSLLSELDNELPVNPQKQTTTATDTTVDDFGRTSDLPMEGFAYNAVKDAGTKLGQWWEGGKTGYAEMQRAGESTNAVLTDPNATPEQMEQAVDYNQNAALTFLDQTLKPVSYAAGVVSPIMALPALAADAGSVVKEEVGKGNTYAPNVAGALAAKFSGAEAVAGAVKDPQAFGAKAYNEPITTAMELLPAALTGALAYKGIRGMARGEKTTGKLETAELETLANELPDVAEQVKDIEPPAAPVEVAPKVDGSNILTIGEEQLGKPYELGADGTNSTDCGLFTQQTLGKAGVELDYRTADGQYRQLETEGKTFASEAEAQPGDLVFWDVPTNREKWTPSDDPAAVNSDGQAYKGITHVGIYAGEGKVLQAGRHGVSYADINDFGDIVGFGKTGEGGKVTRGIMPRDEEPSAVRDVERGIDEDIRINEDIATQKQEPWEMTQREYFAKDEVGSNTDSWESAVNDHRNAVEKALMEDKVIPEQVLKQYSELVEKYPDKVTAIEQKISNEINSIIEPATPAMGMSVKLTKQTPKQETSKFSFADKEVETRWQEASKGIQKESLIAKIKESAKDLWHKASRVYEYLPNVPEFSQLKFDLLKLEKQKTVASERTAKFMQGITLKLDKPGMDLFTRKVILDDLAQTDGNLPFGLTPETLSKEKALIDEAVKNNPDIAQAAEKRKQVWDAIKQDYSKAMKDIGFDVSNRIGREDYFRHQVLEYANLRAVTGSGARLKTPTGRGFLKEREGSAKDINANYLQAEFEVMAQMMYDTELAKTIKAVDKGQSIRGKLIEEFGDEWRQNIPEGYTTWQPREGSSFYMANSIPERLANQVLSGALEEIGVAAGDIKQVLAKGSPFKELVVKQEVADTLNKIAAPPSESAIGKLSRSLVTPWKVWTLMSPTRAIKYNLRNVTGDADALFAMNPTAFKEVPKATGELYQAIYGDRAMTSEMGEWFKRGGMESTSPVQELTDINGLRMFEKFADKDANFIKNAWNGYWSKVRTATQFREAIFRYATYLDYLKQMDSNGGKPRNFGASRPEEVMALSDIRDRAFELSNKVLGAYDNVSVLGKDIRTHIIPFWSWYETNFSRYGQFLRNQKEGNGWTGVGQAISQKFMGNILIRSPYYAYAVGSFTLKAGMMWAALQAYNQLVFPNEEKELPIDEQARPHIVLGRDENGKVKYFSRLGSFPDFLEWVGLDTPVKDVKDFLNGNRSMKEIVQDMAKSPLNKLVQGVSPTIKMPAEILTGKKLFPDALNPRSIKDEWQYAWDSMGLGNEFKAISHTLPGMKPRPTKPYLTQDTAENILYYKSEPNQTAYYNIQDKKREFLKDIGKGGDGDFSSPKSEALRNYKIAIRLKDGESAAYYLSEYMTLGGNKKGLKKSLESLDPLSGINDKDEKKFKESLNGEERQELEKAKHYYKTVMLGK